MTEAADKKASPRTLIVLDDDLPSVQRVAIEQGAWIELRPCTALEYYEASERARPLIAGLVLGRRAEDDLVAVLGPEFGEPRGPDDGAFAAAASERLALIEIVAACATAWEGFGDAEGRPAELNRANIARLLRFPAWADKISKVVNAPLYKRRAEGNASAASPSGGAAAAANGAQAAPQAVNDAYGAAEAATDQSALSTSSNH